MRGRQEAYEAKTDMYKKAKRREFREDGVVVSQKSPKKPPWDRNGDSRRKVRLRRKEGEAKGRLQRNAVYLLIATCPAKIINQPGASFYNIQLSPLIDG